MLVIKTNNSLLKAGCYRYNPKTGFELIPNYEDNNIKPTSNSKTTPSFFRIKTHKLGYRIPLSENASKNIPFGIMSVGCSYTFGEDVNAEETFTFLTSNHFNLSSYNYGVSSYSYASVIQQLKYLKENGTLDLLRPKILILGAGNWLYQRSLSPFYPTVNPQCAYPYISKVNGKLQISYPPDFYSTKHLFNLRNYYFPFTTANLTPKRFFLITQNLPRFLTAWAQNSIIYRNPKVFNKYIASKTTSFELYDFVLTEIEEIVSQYKTKIIVLWMPYYEGDFTDGGLVTAVHYHEGIYLVNGLEALHNYDIKKEDYEFIHPRPSAHKAYANQIIKIIDENKLLK